MIAGLSSTIRTIQTTVIFLKITLLIMFGFYFDEKDLKILKCDTQNKVHF